MTRPESPPKLEELADLFGVQTTNTDATGRFQPVASGTVLAVLRSLGAELDPEAIEGSPGPAAEQAVAEALRTERLRQHRQVVEPVLAVRTGGRSGGTAPVAVALPRHLHPRDCWLTLGEEGGQVHRTRLLPAISRPLPGRAVEGERMDRYEVPVSRDPLPVGYHRLTVEGPDLHAECLVVVAPTCPEPARGWGAFLPLYALRTDTDWGVGNFGHLARLAEWIGELGGDFVGTLPLYPGYLDG
ncbi:MAG TPA: 4-alpha-glucanotransferase, partial [Acidimicrobiales bacterium]|nr:4-alpha-glucanotransferase [Acidimicrobiales bacterium]